MNVVSLFSGAGGGELASQHLLGWDTIAYVESDGYCQHLLKKRISDGLLHDAPIYGDIRELTDEDIAEFVSLSYFRSNSNTEADMPAHRKDYDEAVRQYEAGLSVGDVADIHNVTRQSMYYILKRRSVSFRPNVRYGADNHFYRGGLKSSDRAQNLCEKALEKGLLTKPDKCETCGDSGSFADGRSAIQAHHADYNNPLEVQWLCQKCHHEWHKTNTPIERKDAEESSGDADMITAGFP